MIKSNQSTIEINGRRYDAKTGQLTKEQPRTAAKAAPTTRKSHSGNVSDIARPRPAASRGVHKPTQKSQTLMRQAVKKPAKPTAVKQVKTPAKHQAKPVKKQFTGGIITHNQDIARQVRATKVKQSNLVSKFADHKTVQHPITAAPGSAKIAQLAVQPAPAIQAAHPVNNILEKGLRNANSHTLPLKKTKRQKSPKRKFLSYGAASLAALLLVGFMAYQSVPSLSVHYASTRSGVTASLPGYKPAGFAMSNKVEYNPGQITLNFSSNSDARTFTITQRESSWNSDALLSSYVSTKTDQVQKYEDKGRTIFLYGNANATWVNGGVWYDINGDSQLNSDQLIRIASSM